MYLDMIIFICYYGFIVKYYINKNYPYDPAFGGVLYRVRDNVEYLSIYTLTWKKDTIDVSYLKEISIDEYIKTVSSYITSIHYYDIRKKYIQLVKLMAFWEEIDV